LISYKIQQNNEIDLKVPSMFIYPFAVFLKNDSSSNNTMLIDIAVTDCPAKKNRFFLSYTFLVLDNIRLQVQSSLAIFQNVLSITSLFRCGL
jgi:NADH:ubiquinone oxidoreductase subunit C